MYYNYIKHIKIFRKTLRLNYYYLKYIPLDGSSYKKLLKELNHPRKGLINIQNIDGNECLKWNLVRYLNLADYHPAKIIRDDKNFLKKLDFKAIKPPIKI